MIQIKHSITTYVHYYWWIKCWQNLIQNLQSPSLPLVNILSCMVVQLSLVECQLTSLAIQPHSIWQPLTFLYTQSLICINKTTAMSVHIYTYIHMHSQLQCIIFMAIGLFWLIAKQLTGYSDTVAHTHNSSYASYFTLLLRSQPHSQV